MRINLFSVVAGLAFLPAIAAAQTPTPAAPPTRDSTTAPVRDTAGVAGPTTNSGTNAAGTNTNSGITPVTTGNSSTVARSKSAPKNPINGTNSGTTNSGTSTGITTMSTMNTDASASRRGATVQSKAIAGLTGLQLVALQQELRDRKCGNSHVTGRLDAATRIAIRNCARKLGVANSAAAVLVAFDIGFNSSDVNSSGSSRKQEE